MNCWYKFIGNRIRTNTLYLRSIVYLFLMVFVISGLFGGTHRKAYAQDDPVNKEYAPPTITKEPSDANVVAGDTAKFYVSASGKSIKYQWYVWDGKNDRWAKSGATGTATRVLSVKAEKILNGKLYKCKVTNAGGSIETKVVRLIVKPVISTQPSSVTVVEGEDATFYLTSNSPSAVYQWEVSDDNGKIWSNSAVTGNTSSKITVTTKQKYNGYLYRCKVSNGKATEYSKAVKLTVNKKSGNPPVIISQPSSITVIRGSTGKITVKASGKNLRYQWYISKNGGKTWVESAATGNKTNTITITATKGLDGRLYKCKVSNNGGSVYSKVAKYTTLAVISDQPSRKMVSAQSEVTFSIKARSSVTVYRWQVSSDNGKTWNDSFVTGNATDTIRFTAEPEMDGYYYRCKVTNGAWEEYSNKVRLRVRAKIILQPALILDNVEQKPSSIITVDEGKVTLIKIKVYGKSSLYDYQWQVSKDDGSTWTDVQNANLSIYSFTPIAKQNGYKYRCVVSNKNNNNDGKAKTISNEITLKVK
ncbi:Immunoglobulin domain-containing protein [Eubacterium ruminantium]|nr:Immunoglobulin domain-containing protein [Eubacterium ruminantium]